MSKLLEDSQRKNKSLILQTIRKNAPISRIKLSQITGLNKATVSNITKDFLGKGIIRESGDIISTNKRKTIGLSLNMGNFSAITIRLKANHIRSAIYSMDGTLQNFREALYNDSLNIAPIIQQIQEEIEEQIMYCHNNKHEILGISIGCLGELYIHNGTYTIKADGFKTLSQTDICHEIRQKFPDYKVIINHDANFSAMAELDYYTKTKKHCPSSLLNIVGGSGLKSGIVINGKIIQGYHGIAGEVGHMGINCIFPHTGLNGNISYNRTSYEQYASPLAIQNSIIENLYDYPRTALSLDATLDDIYQAYNFGDPLAEWAMNRAARYLAYGLTGLIYVLDPEVIVLGDRIPHNNKFMCVVNKYLSDFLPPELSSDITIVFSGCKDDSVLMGAGITLFDDILQENTIIDFINHYLTLNEQK